MPFASSPPVLFPTYLLPSLPFRRRHSSTSSTATTSTLSSSPPLTSLSPSSPVAPEPYLTSHTSHLRCNRCLADLAHASQIVSKGFMGRHGRAYLVAPTDLSSSSLLQPPRSGPGSSSARSKPDLPDLPNTFTHKPVPRQLVTGAHTVADIACAHCGSVLGWKYVAAAEEAQRYKVGKVILETKRVCRSSTWEGGGEGQGPAMTTNKGEVEFDSQDEDECEDLFAGVWTAKGAAKRRRAKKFGKGAGDD